jgi:hypothetical protein
MKKQLISALFMSACISAINPAAGDRPDYFTDDGKPLVSIACSLIQHRSIQHLTCPDLKKTGRGKISTYTQDRHLVHFSPDGKYRSSWGRKGGRKGKIIHSRKDLTFVELMVSEQPGTTLETIYRWSINLEGTYAMSTSGTHVMTWVSEWECIPSAAME